jgi:hypothetical protein
MGISGKISDLKILIVLFGNVKIQTIIEFKQLIITRHKVA